MERMPKPIAYLEGDHWFSWDRTGRPQYVAAIKVLQRDDLRQHPRLDAWV